MYICWFQHHLTLVMFKPRTFHPEWICATSTGGAWNNCPGGVVPWVHRTVRFAYLPVFIRVVKLKKSSFFLIFPTQHFCWCGVLITPKTSSIFGWGKKNPVRSFWKAEMPGIRRGSILVLEPLGAWDNTEDELILFEGNPMQHNCCFYSEFSWSHSNFLLIPLNYRLHSLKVT